MRRGAPGRGSSTKPSSRFCRNRRRQRPTVCRVIRNSAAIAGAAWPAAHAKMIRARCANPCAVVRRRAHCSSVVRSLGLMTTRTGRGPRLAIRASLYSMSQRHDQSVSELQRARSRQSPRPESVTHRAPVSRLADMEFDSQANSSAARCPERSKRASIATGPKIGASVRRSLSRSVRKASATWVCVGVAELAVSTRAWRANWRNDVERAGMGPEKTTPMLS